MGIKYKYSQKNPLIMSETLEVYYPANLQELSDIVSFGGVLCPAELSFRRGYRWLSESKRYAVAEISESDIESIVNKAGGHNGGVDTHVKVLTSIPVALERSLGYKIVLAFDVDKSMLHNAFEELLGISNMLTYFIYRSLPLVSLKKVVYGVGADIAKVKEVMAPVLMDQDISFVQYDAGTERQTTYDIDGPLIAFASMLLSDSPIGGT